jgi:hypothetical protein
MEGDSIEISVKGHWVTVPALKINGDSVIITGRWVKMAAVHDEEWSEKEIECPELYVETLKDNRSQGLKADIFTFTQKPSAPAPRYSYPLEWDSVAVVHLKTFQDWWQSLPQETRKNVRRSQKRGVVVKVMQFDDELIKGIGEVNNDSPVRQGRRYTHYGKSLDQVRKDHSGFADRSDFIFAYLDSQVIGFLKVVYRGEVASILQLTPKASHHDKRPANAMLAKAIELCEARKISCLTYGMFNYGNKRDTPITEFKIRNGFVEVLVPRFYVPLTALGEFSMKLKLHRGILGILPPRVIAVGVAVRTKWYDLRLLMSRCSSMLERPNSNRQMGRSNPPAGSNV